MDKTSERDGKAVGDMVMKIRSRDAGDLDMRTIEDGLVRLRKIF